MKAIGAGTREKAWDSIEKGFNEVTSSVHMDSLFSGLRQAGHDVVEVWVKVLDGEGKAVLEKMFQTVGDGTTQVIEGAVNVLEDMSRRMNNLSTLEINRASQRLLAERAAGAQY